MLQTKCGVRQSWATCFFLVHLGCLRLGVLEPRLWWNGLRWHLKGFNHMIIWYLLEMAWTLIVIFWKAWSLHLEGMHLVSFWPLMLIMRIHQSRVQLQAFGFEFIHNIQGSNNYDGLKHWTWVIMVQTMAKQMHNEMQFTWTDPKVGSMGHCNMGRR